MRLILIRDAVHDFSCILALKRQFNMIAADDIHFHCFPDKIRLDISCQSSARQRIHRKHQALFSSKDKSNNKNKVSSAVIFWLSCSSLWSLSE